MTSNTARTIAIAALCLLVLAVAAAALPSMESGGADGASVGQGGGGGTPESDGVSADSDSDDEDERGGRMTPVSDRSTLCIEALASREAFWALLLAALGGGALSVQRLGVRTTLVLALALTPIVFGAWATLTTDCARSERADDGGGGGDDGEVETAGEPGADGADGDDGELPAVAVPGLALLAVLLLAVLGAAGALLSTDGDDPEERQSDPEPERDDAARRSELGRAAGQAADRIEAGDELENEVYRAWREMADSLPVERPTSSTPGEFAAAAREVGLDEDDVAELTALFDAVRYGDRDATEERERRAVAALRRIEEVHGGERSRPDRDSGGGERGG